MEAFDHGCLVLCREGEVAGHVATILSWFWSPSRPLTMQQWVWYIVVWADGERERSAEDYPPWITVTDIRNGVFVVEDDGPRSGEYLAEWLPEPEAKAQWERLGLTVEDF